jgi:hypothetical protein
MHEDDHALIDLVRGHLSSQDAKECRAFYDAEIKDAGDTVRIGLREVPMPFRGVRVFVDLMPNANWGHRVTYLLVSQDLTHCVQYEDQFPPFSGDPPDHWQALPLTA